MPVFLGLTPVVMHQSMNSGAAKMRSAAGGARNAPLRLWPAAAAAAAVAAAGMPLVTATCESKVVYDMRVRSHVVTIHHIAGSCGILTSTLVVLS